MDSNGAGSGPYSFYIDRKNNGLGIVEGPGITDDDYHQLVINLDPRSADLQAQILNAAHAAGIAAERKVLADKLHREALKQCPLCCEALERLASELERAP